ncbi:MAG: TlpA family protein disulfide reductase [Bacteroidales bacterium]|nr:TlpA family protein disulfide reductase [Bacteroidales bacterium]
MKKTFILSAFVAIAMVACAQTPEERVKAYEAAHQAMLDEYSATMDSLADDREKAQAYYDEFVPKYIEFNLDAAKKNPDNEVAIQVLANLRGLIEDEQAAEIIANMPAEMQENEQVAALKKTLDTRIATSAGHPFVDFTVNTVVGQTRSVPPQPKYKEVKLSDYVGKGKYILLDFWSPWCGPCRREMPNIKAVYDKYHGDKFDVVSIAVWERQPVEVTIETAQKLDMTWNQINNAGREPAELYGVEAIPHLILFGPDGTILARGFHGAEIDQIVSSYLK